VPLPATEANVAIKDLLANEWNGDPITVSKTFKTAWISTGTFDEENSHAQITLRTVSEPTGPTHLAPGGGLASWVDGTVDCNVWVPYDREAYTSSGKVKGFRYDLKRKVHSIIEDNQEGTGELTRLVTGTIRDDVEIERSPPPFSALIPIQFQYRSAPR
jgi:hypothetical protein